MSNDEIVALVRQAILHSLDDGRATNAPWRFYDENEDKANSDRVDFADRVASFLPFRTPPSESPRTGVGAVEALRLMDEIRAAEASPVSAGLRSETGEAFCGEHDYRLLLEEAARLLRLEGVVYDPTDLLGRIDAALEGTARSSGARTANYTDPRFTEAEGDLLDLWAQYTGGHIGGSEFNDRACDIIADKISGRGIGEPYARSHGAALTPLERFGLAVLEESRNEIGDVDGGWLQEEAVKLGLLVSVHVTEPCGEGCRCAEYGDFPQDCLRQSTRSAREEESKDG